MFEGKRKVRKKSVNEGLAKFMPAFAVCWRVVVVFYGRCKYLQIFARFTRGSVLAGGEFNLELWKRTLENSFVSGCCLMSFVIRC